MNNLTKLIVFLMVFSIMLPSILASSLDVQLTPSKEIALSITSDDLGWQDSQINIFDEKGNLVYEFTDKIYYSNEPAVELLKCPDCKHGFYSIKVIIKNSTLNGSFSIEKPPFDWFWAIICILIVALILVFFLVMKTPNNKPLKLKSKTSSRKKVINSKKNSLKK